MNVLKLKYLWLILPFLAMGCEDDGSANADRLALSHDTYGFPVGGGDFTVLVSSTVKYSVKSEGDWLVMTGQEGDRYSYKADENTSYNMREALVIVTAQNKSLVDTVRVYQVGKDGLFLDEAERAKTIGLEGGSVEVNLNFTNMGFRVKPMVDWITYVPTKALQQAKITLQVLANTEYGSRTGKVVIVSKDGLLSDTVTITQNELKGVVLTKDKITVESDGGVLGVEIKHNVSGIETIIPDTVAWVHAVVKSKALSADSVYLKIDENTAPKERQAPVIFKNGELTDTLWLTQSAALPTIEVNTDGSYTVYASCSLSEFKDSLSQAAEGTVFILKSDCSFDLGTKFSITKGITIKGESTTKRAVFKYTTGEILVTSDCGNVIFENLEMYATNGYVFDMPSGSTAKIAGLHMENCYVKGAKSALFRTKATTGGIGLFKLNNSIFENIGDAANDQGFISVAADCNTYVMNFSVTNSTFLGCSNLRPKDFISVAKNMKTAFTLTLNNNTFYNCSNAKSIIILSAANAPFATIEVKKNIFVCGTGNVKGVSLNAATPAGLTIQDNCVPVANALSDFSDSALITDDPQFKNAANNDFTVQNATVKAAAVGDPRWLK